MNRSSKRIRLDQALTGMGLAPSRSRARDMIGRKCVQVDGKTVSKSGTLVVPQNRIEIDDPAQNYVSRAALKLIAALDHADLDVRGKHAVDLGASTGGFTQVLLERGASHVWAVDVGHGQMAQSLLCEPRITLMEGRNARHLSEEDFGSKPDVIVSDMSFISIMLAAEPALMLAANQAIAVLLVKPQFEVGRDAVGKGGIVNDEARVAETLEQIKSWFIQLPGWHLTHFLPSPVPGGDGNKEYLLCGKRVGDQID